MTSAPQTHPDACSVHAPVVPEKAESRTRWVVYLTAVMMVAELVVGYLSRSLALTADGWHMMTHVGALGLSALAYWYARTRAHETRFAFGTGKVYALAGFSSAALLLVVAAAMAYSSIERLITPETLRFNEALPVAVIGLLVNLFSAWLLAGGKGGHDHDHGHSHDHDHEHEHDHNLRAAYMHVVADALTSVLAIVAIVGAHLWGLNRLDPAVAILGAVIIVKWGIKLVSESARQLIDLDPSTKSRDAVRAALEGMGGTRVCDLHLWRVGPGRLVCVVAVQSTEDRPLEDYKKAVYQAVAVEHLTVEVRPA
ncbi:MAG: CDF family Co(II)/Ni(II) efflux transporter DmeF [Archangiaceae bacterium]|nr:CDF family Co(II)/Ni(II) efflux transporter DmeF [Archangiaceae bacterium]